MAQEQSAQQAKEKKELTQTVDYNSLALVQPVTVTLKLPIHESMKDKAKVNRTSQNANGTLVLVCSLQSSLNSEFWSFDVASGQRVNTFTGHTTGSVNDVKWSADGRRALSGGDDGTVRVWDVASARWTSVLKLGSPVFSVAWSNDPFVVAGLTSGAIEVWDVEQGQRVRELKGHSDIIFTLDVSFDQNLLLSASDDNTARLWKLDSGEFVLALQSHNNRVYTAVLNRDGKRALSGSADATVRLWDLATGQCKFVLEGHTSSVTTVAWHPSNVSFAASGSSDQTVRVWNVDTGTCLHVLEARKNPLYWYLHWSPDGQRVVSCDENGMIFSWDLSGLILLTISTTAVPSDQVQYTNAKVLLVGDSGAGKTGLSMRLAKNEWEKSDSTVGAWSTRWSLGVAKDATGTGEREIWLWDFGGQHDQRLVHQLFMDDTALAVLVFDGQREGFLDAVRQWNRDIARASRAGCRKLLVAGRVDVGAPRVSAENLKAFAEDNGFLAYFETSAKSGSGCQDLKKGIRDGIDWQRIPWRSSPAIFITLRNAIVALKDAAMHEAVGPNKVSGNVLLRFDELRDQLRMRLGAANFTDEQLKAVLSLLAGPGVVWELKFGGYYLLHPELVSSYLQGMLRQDRLQFGYTNESDVFAGALPKEVTRLDNPNKDRLLLLELHHTLLERPLCFREVTKDKGPLLIFPMRFVTDPPSLKWQPPVIVSYTFHGYIEEAYATLVVRLHHTQPFAEAELFRDFAQFATSSGIVGVKIKRLADPVEFEVFREPRVANDTVIKFCAFVHEHLLQYDQDVRRLRHISCLNCKSKVANLDAVMAKIERYNKNVKAGFKVERPSAVCALCDQPVELWDNIEEHYAHADFQDRVRELQEYSKAKLQRQAAERIVIATIISLVLQAGHEVEELSVPEVGAQLKVTFKPEGTSVLIVLGTPENLRPSTKATLVKSDAQTSVNERSLFEGEVLQYRHEWAARRLCVVLVIRVNSLRGNVDRMSTPEDAEIQWTLLSGVRVINQRAEFQGQCLDVDAVRGWKDLQTTAVEEGLATLTLTAPVEPLPWTQRDRRNDVFVSFRGGDPFGSGSTVRISLAQPLATGLRPLAVFFDDRGLDEMMATAPGTTIDGILQGLLSTQGGGVVAVLITPTFFKRKWPTLELAVAHALHEAGQVRLLPFLLGNVTASSVETQPFVQQVCKGLDKVHMIPVPAADPQAAVAFVKSKVEETAALQRGVAGATAEASFSALLNEIAMMLKNEGTLQDVLLRSLLHRARGENETLAQALDKTSVTPADVSRLRDAMALHFTRPDHRPLLQLVDSYQFKWHKTPLSVPVSESGIGEVKARVEQWWKENPSKD